MKTPRSSIPKAAAVLPDSCPVVPSLHFLARKWMLPLMLELFAQKKPQRFSELLRTLHPITPKLLSMRLKELTKAGYLERKTTSRKGAESVAYQPTESAKDLTDVLKAIRHWCLKDEKNRGICQNCGAREHCALA